MLVGSPNFFTQIFEMDILKAAGKYSFGIYLFHPMCIDLVKNNFKPGLKYELYFYVLALSFFIGFSFFYLVENILIKLASFVCGKLSQLKYFEQKEIS